MHCRSIGTTTACITELMAELQEQYDKFKKTGLVLDEKNMPIVGGQKLDGARHNPTSVQEGRSRALAAAAARAKKTSLMGGGRVGGNSHLDARAGSWREASPAEMAALAAAVRAIQSCSHSY